MMQNIALGVGAITAGAITAIPRAQVLPSHSSPQLLRRGNVHHGSDCFGSSNHASSSSQPHTPALLQQKRRQGVPHSHLYGHRVIAASVATLGVAMAATGRSKRRSYAVPAPEVEEDFADLLYNEEAYREDDEAGNADSLSVTANPVVSFLEQIWYTFFHAWRTWYFTTLFMLGTWASQRFDLQLGFWILVGHPAMYASFGAIAYGVYKDDWKMLQYGDKRMPYDANIWSMFQWARPDRILAFFGSSREISDRAKRNGAHELPGVVRPAPGPSGEYPEYYTRNFHFQTDGWLSDESAANYEMSTEVLFGGTQDAMQRLAFGPLHAWLARREDTSPIELLEAGCGTGRLLCQLACQFPNSEFTALDLSPYYLDACRSKYADWQANHADAPIANFMHGNMETIDLADASRDVVVCAYVFHELPPYVRRRVAKEFFRVLRPGGLCILLDSVQSGDLGEEMGGALQWFPRQFHEPYYASWLQEDLSRLFGAYGFRDFSNGLSHVSKMCSWVKPFD